MLRQFSVIALGIRTRWASYQISELFIAAKKCIDYKALIKVRHRGINPWKSIYSLQGEISFVQQGASMANIPVTEPVVKHGTTKYQMKEMDIIFPLIPLSFL